MEDSRHPLSFWFSAPFRTPLTLRTPAVVGAPRPASQALEAAAGALQHALARGTASATGAAPPTVASPLATCLEPGELRYRMLAEDADQQFVAPLLEIRGDGRVAAALAASVEAWLGAPDFSSDAGTHFAIDPDAVAVHLFDNTIGVIEWRLDLRIPDDALARVLDAIDGQSCDATIAAVAAAQAGCVHDAVRVLDTAFDERLPGRGWRRRRPVVQRPREFRVFVDMRGRMAATGELRALDAAGDAGVMWVSRLAQVAEADSGLLASLARWSPGLPADDAPPDGFIPAVGNSVVLQSPGECPSDLHKAYRKMQYLQALVDVHGRNINALFSEFLAHRHGVLASTMTTLSAIHSHIGYIRMQATDVFAGLQGARLRHVERLRGTWGFDARLEDLNLKSRMAGEEITALARSSSMRYQRVIQFGLGSVGLLALLDVLINLTALSHSQDLPSRGTWGLLHLVHKAHPDTILTGAALVLCAGMVGLGFALRRGDR